MLSLAALAFVTPIFGLQLELDSSVLQLSPEVIAIAETADSLSVGAGVVAEIAVPPPDVAPTPTPTPTDTAAPTDAPPPPTEPTPTTDAQAPVEPAPTEASLAPTAATTAVDLQVPDGETAEPADDVGAQLARRARFARAHRRLGMATWGAMTAAVVTGTLVYINNYGFFAPASETRCVRGNTLLGDDCVGSPVLHATSVGATAALYFTTFGLSFAMPDPIGLDRGNSESARTLRQHKRMRWIHFSGMLLQGVLGTVISNGQWFGLDRANDYRTLQALSTVHLLTGYATYGILTYTGARMAF